MILEILKATVVGAGMLLLLVAFASCCGAFIASGMDDKEDKR